MENDYTESIEDVLKVYAVEAEILYIIHNTSFQLYRRRGYHFTIPVIIMSTISGVMSFTHDVSNSTIGQYTIGGINILVGIISTVYKFLDYSSYEHQHKILSTEYMHLFEDIRATLSKHPKDRENAITYIEKIESKRYDLYDNFILIAENVRTEFEAKYKNVIKDLPLRLNHIVDIKIYGRLPVNTHTPAVNRIQIEPIDTTIDTTKF